MYARNFIAQESHRRKFTNREDNKKRSRGDLDLDIKIDWYCIHELVIVYASVSYFNKVSFSAVQVALIASQTSTRTHDWEEWNFCTAIASAR